MTLLYTHDVFGEHEVPNGHMERQSRYGAVDAALRTNGLDGLERREPPLVARDAVLRAHPESFADQIANAAPADGFTQLDPDTFMGPHSLEATARAAGGTVAAVDAVMAGEAKTAFVAARPPGHHSTPTQAMGFCLYNQVAIGALHALANGAARVAVADFDVHHGNGTQDILAGHPDAFFASSHEWPQYPGTGKATERGQHDNLRNVPIATGEGSDAFRRAWGDKLLPTIADFAPEVLLISAGFDGHRADPVGGLTLTEDDYAWITAELLALSRASGRTRVVSVLEGGYNLGALASSAASHVSMLSR